MIVDGKAIAEEVYSRLIQKRSLLHRPLTLGIVVMEPTPAIESFVRIKTRAAAKLDIVVERIDIAPDATTTAVIEAVEALAHTTDALIVQLPLPAHIDTEAVLAAIPTLHDVDVINPRIPESERTIVAPVARAVQEILSRYAVAIPGKKVVVIGAGRLVGAPVAALLKALGAIVSVITKEHGSLSLLKEAEIIVSGAGEPRFIQPPMITPGVVLIDAGTSDSRVSGTSAVVGDADPSCAEIASVFTPVPGGVGPVAVAMIFENLLDLIKT